MFGNSIENGMRFDTIPSKTQFEVNGLITTSSYETIVLDRVVVGEQRSCIGTRRINPL